ncbi:MAG: non-homologous end-joining DNA ligase [Candidatus Pacearchaeota archaeon]
MKYKPMLAKLGDEELLKSSDFIFEPKLDGTRVLVYKKGESIELVNRRGRDITYRYPELLEIAKSIEARSCVLDAELVVLNEKGFPDFNLLQQREQLENKAFILLRSKELPATLFVFDILELDGKTLVNLKLLERKKILQKVIAKSPFIVSCPWTRNGELLWKQVMKQGLEGVMAKKIDSCYEQKRSEAWLKIKRFNTADAVVVGFTKGEGFRAKTFGALLLAFYDNNSKKFVYAGKVGTGFDQASLEKLSKLMKKLKTDKFRGLVIEEKIEDKVVWLKPELVVEVKFLELTKKHELRAPSFVRIRFDKEPKECVFETLDLGKNKNYNCL